MLRFPLAVSRSRGIIITATVAAAAVCPAYVSVSSSRRTASSSFSSAAAAAAPHVPTKMVRPLRTVEQLLEAGDLQGVRAAQGVFDEFRAHCRASLSTVSTESIQDSGPIQSFCDRAEDVEPFCVLMMKVLCDAKRWEDIRFMFALSLLEIQGKPSIEFFNVYLLSISLTDSFNNYEIENVVDVMREREVEQDVVTRLSLLVLYMRMGRDCGSLWPDLCADIKDVIKTCGVEEPSSNDSNDSSAVTALNMRYPLLALRLQHSFLTALRVHHDVDMIHDIFTFLALVDSSKLPPSALVPYIVLSVGNGAAHPQYILSALQLLDAHTAAAALSGAATTTPTKEGEERANAHQVGSTPSTSSATAGEGEDGAPSSIAVQDASLRTASFLNESTALKLMSKCAKWKDAATAVEARRWVEAPGVVSPENLHAVYLMLIYTFAATGRVSDALDVCEDNLALVEEATSGSTPSAASTTRMNEENDNSSNQQRVSRIDVESLYTPGTRPKLFLSSRRMTLLTADPINTLILAIVDHGVVSVDAAFTHLQSRAVEGRQVTHRSLNLIMMACARLGDALRAKQCLESFPEFHAVPSAATYASYLEALAAQPNFTPPGSHAIAQFESVLRDMDDHRIPVSKLVLHTMLRITMEAHNHVAALRVMRLHVKYNFSIDRTASSMLLKELCLTVDVDATREVIKLMRESKSTVDPRTISMCRASFRKWGIELGEESE